jgi:hypothetical protein
MMEARSGIALARAYWSDVVGPLLDRVAPSQPRAVGRFGPGSDVLGLDDEMSRDHDWGLRLQVVVRPEARSDISTALEEHLPDRYADLPTRIAFTGQPAPTLAVDVLTMADLHSRLGFDPCADPTTSDWLSLTGQAVLEITAGEVFEDTAGELTALRQSLTWYPDDIWRYLVACDWKRVDQELPLMQRAGDRGDDLGSRVIAARLVDIVMHLGFLVSRRWAPYAKWRGTLFRTLPLTAEVQIELAEVLRADDWRSRAQHLRAALEAMADEQRRAGLPAAFPPCMPFWDRPYVHVNPALTTFQSSSESGSPRPDLPPGLGSVEQRTDNVDLLMDTARRRVLVGCPS